MPKINTSAKGWRKERECRKLLEQEGWNIVFKSIRWKWGTLDFASLFDTIAVKMDDTTPKWLFISNKHYGSAQTKYPQHQSLIREFKSLYGCDNMEMELWLWHKPKWAGRGSNKVWLNARWEIIPIKTIELESLNEVG